MTGTPRFSTSFVTINSSSITWFAKSHTQQKRSRTRRAPHFEAFCRGSFSAVWTPRIARAGSLFSSFRDLHDLRIFALLESQALQNFGSFCKTSAKLRDFAKRF